MNKPYTSELNDNGGTIVFDFRSYQSGPRQQDVVDECSREPDFVFVDVMDETFG